MCQYLNLWADAVIVRHKDMKLLENMTKYLTVPMINAMTNENHPCEILSDLYSLWKLRNDITKDRYLFCGVSGNIGLTWKDAAEVLEFDFAQCCPEGYEMNDIPIYHEIEKVIVGKDIICTDSYPSGVDIEVSQLQITTQRMKLANEYALLNPCLPFFRGEEVSEDVIDTKFFVGYQFKESLLWVQQAIIIWLMLGGNVDES